MVGILQRTALSECDKSGVEGREAIRMYHGAESLGCEVHTRTTCILPQKGHTSFVGESNNAQTCLEISNFGESTEMDDCKPCHPWLIRGAPTEERIVSVRTVSVTQRMGTQP
jgi:hypothetical protein